MKEESYWESSVTEEYESPKAGTITEGYGYSGWDYATPVLWRSCGGLRKCH